MSTRRPALGEKQAHLKISDLHFLMALTELNRRSHYYLNLAIDTINSIPIQDQNAKFMTAFIEVLQRKFPKQLNVCF